MEKKEDKEEFMKCKGAIFDMDGLLFDTEKLFQQTWNELASRQDKMQTTRVLCI